MSKHRFAAMTAAALLGFAAPAYADVSATELGRDYFIGPWSINGAEGCGGTLLVFYANGAFADIDIGDGKVDDLGVWSIDGAVVVIDVSEPHRAKNSDKASISIQKSEPDRAEVTLHITAERTEVGVLTRCQEPQ